MTQVARPAPERLDSFTVPSQPGNERLALARVAGSAQGRGLSDARLERLKTAVAEATMNAIEHGNGNRPEIPVEVEVTQDGDQVIVAITDQGEYGGGLIAPHHRDARIRPHEQKSRVEGSPAHAVIAGSERPSDDDGQLGHP